MNDETLREIRAYIEQYTDEKIELNLECIQSDAFKVRQIGCCEDTTQKIYSEEERRQILAHGSDTFVEFVWFLLRKNNIELTDFVNDNDLSNKYMTDLNYEPSKEEAILIAFKFNMNLDETLSLIGRSGYFISKKDIFDLIIRYCLNHNIYNIEEVNYILKSFKQKTL